VTRQQTTFTRTTSRHQRLQTKTPEKEHVSMASQAWCESCFQDNFLIFTFRQANGCPTPALRFSAAKK